jgi:hypothetical protein
VRNFNYTMGGSSFINSHFERKIRAWAYSNALTLIFLSIMFVITWLFLVVLIWRS